MAYKTVAELKEEAKKQKIKGYSTMRRSELCAVLGYKEKKSPPKSKHIATIEKYKKQSPTQKKTYYTLTGNGAERSFEVVIHEAERHVSVYEKVGKGNKFSMLAYESNYQDIFIGYSPKNDMTLFSGGYGKKWDGNSILVCVEGKEYVYIGEKIYSFHGLHPIVEYISPIGNNSVPYPYAIDDHENYYLFTEKVIVAMKGKYKYHKENPYEYFYDKHLITNDLGLNNSSNSSSNTSSNSSKPLNHPFEGIRHFWIGNEEYTMTYEPFPAEEYERITKINTLSRSPMFYDPDKTNKTSKVDIYINNQAGKKIKLTKSEYVALMKRFGKQAGFKPLHLSIRG